MEFLGLMEAFGMDVGIGALEPDFDRVCRVDIDGMRVSFLEMPQSGQLVTWAAVCEPPPEGREQLYQMLMEAMFMGRETGGGAFSVDAETGSVYLHRFDALQTMDLDSFKAMLEKFANVLENWRRRVADFRPQTSDGPQGVAFGQFGMDGFLQV